MGHITAFFPPHLFLSLSLMSALTFRLPSSLLLPFSLFPLPFSFLGGPLSKAERRRDGRSTVCEGFYLEGPFLILAPTLPDRYT
jgi:hypothetical protein